MAYYATPNVNQSADIAGYFDFVNISADGLFFPVIMFVIWIISFLAMKQYSSSRAWLFSSFFCAILSIILATLNLVAPRFMYIFIMMTAIGFVWLKLEGE